MTTGSKVKVLVTQCTRPLAQRVAKLLPAGQPVLFASAEAVPGVLLHMGNYLTIPRAGEQAFVHEMLKTCLDRQVGALLPLGMAELQPLAGAQQLFSEYGIDILVPSVAELGQLLIIENPPRALPLMVLYNGTGLSGAVNGDERYGSLSGVFTLSDSGDELALCCVAE